MANKEIRIGSVKPSVSSEHEIDLELEAALVELDGDDDIGLAIPNVTFQVRIGIDTTFEGKSDAKFGVFKTPPIRIVKPTPELQIELTANDGVDVIAKQLRVNIAAEMAKMVAADAIDAESKRRTKAEIREVQKRMKEGKAEIGQVRAAFSVLNKYSDHPLAAEVALEIAETHADGTVETYSCFKNAPWSEAVMFKAVERAPLAVLGNIGKIKGEKWAVRIISMIAKCLPKDTIDHLPDYIDMPWAFQIMLQIAEENPRNAFEGIENYEYQPWAKAVAAKAARIDYTAALEFYDLYKYQPWAQEIRNLAESEQIAEREREAERERILAEERRVEAERETERARVLEEERRIEEERQRKEEAMYKKISTDPREVNMRRRVEEEIKASLARKKQAKMSYMVNRIMDDMRTIHPDDDPTVPTYRYRYREELQSRVYYWTRGIELEIRREERKQIEDFRINADVRVRLHLAALMLAEDEIASPEKVLKMRQIEQKAEEARQAQEAKIIKEARKDEEERIKVEAEEKALVASREKLKKAAELREAKEPFHFIRKPFRKLLGIKKKPI